MFFLKVPLELWAEAANYSNYIRNRVFSSTETVSFFYMYKLLEIDKDKSKIFAQLGFCIVTGIDLCQHVGFSIT
jgi:hypothetical protein